MKKYLDFLNIEQVVKTAIEDVYDHFSWEENEVSLYEIADEIQRNFDVLNDIKFGEDDLVTE